MTKLENHVTTTYQQAVEEERKKLLKMIGHLPYVTQEEYAKYKNGGIIKWVTLEEHFTNLTKHHDTH